MTGAHCNPCRHDTPESSQKHDYRSTKLDHTVISRLLQIRPNSYKTVDFNLEWKLLDYQT